jgi:hypothetical protein
MKGEIKTKFDGLRQRIISALAKVEALIDFGEGDEIEEGVYDDGAFTLPNRQYVSLSQKQPRLRYLRSKTSFKDISMINGEESSSGLESGWPFLGLPMLAKVVCSTHSVSRLVLVQPSLSHASVKRKEKLPLLPQSLVPPGTSSNYLSTLAVYLS